MTGVPTSFRTSYTLSTPSFPVVLSLAPSKLHAALHTALFCSMTNTGEGAAEERS